MERHFFWKFEAMRAGEGRRKGALTISIFVDCTPLISDRMEQPVYCDMRVTFMAKR